MGKTRGFRLVKVFKWCIHRRRRRTSTYRRLPTTASTAAATCSRLFRWVRSLRHGARSLCSGGGNRGYIRALQDPVGQQKLPVGVPKGHLAVYVGDKESDTCRVVLPVIYFNHPLFGELLMEAEKVHGFDHPGGIKIPCPKSRLENIQMKIAAANGRRSLPRERC